MAHDETTSADRRGFLQAGAVAAAASLAPGLEARAGAQVWGPQEGGAAQRMVHGMSPIKLSAPTMGPCPRFPVL
jgi:hypothetical protein